MTPAAGDAADAAVPALLLAASGEGGPPSYLPPLVAFLLAAAAIGYVCARLRVVPIVGFLLAGVVIGPNALGLVSDGEVVDAAADIGVILLLFTIGIEFSLERLARVARLIALGGGLQVVGTTAAGTGIALAFGVSWPEAVFTGLLLSLSSTAIVLKLLASKGETGSTTGQTATAFLIFQDLAVVAMVLLVPILGGYADGGDDGGGGLGELAVAVGTALVVVVVTLVVARRLLPPVLTVIARACSPEVFLLAVVALCFGTAYLTSLAGVSVSLGAFLAGLVVSESRQAEQAFSEVLPLQILFSAVFFLSVGMLLDVRFLLEQPLLVAGGVVLALVVKAVIAAGAARLLGVPAGAAVAAGLMLAQVGEFSFVLAEVGTAADLSPAGLGEDGQQAFIAATVLLMVATPGLAALGQRLGGRVEERRRRRGVRSGAGRSADEAALTDDPGAPVAVLGFGDGARALVRVLRELDVPVVVTTLNPDGAREAEELGARVVSGDATRAHVLEAAEIDRAVVVVVADDDPETTDRVLAAAKRVAPQARLIARPQGAVDLDGLVDVGAHVVVDPERASTRRLISAVLRRTRAADVSPRTDTGEAAGRTVVDTEAVVQRHVRDGDACPHVEQSRPVLPSAPGCEDCLRRGKDEWVHLRVCLTCGHVGCCDSSPDRHARSHADGDQHAVMTTAEPDEDWVFCFLDSRTMEVDRYADEPAGLRRPLG